MRECRAAASYLELFRTENSIICAKRIQSTQPAWALLRGALAGHPQWSPAWRDAQPKPAYDILIGGGGGHGLATAYYLPKNHGFANIAVLIKNGILRQGLLLAS